jgi:hypothetical protein
MDYKLQQGYIKQGTLTASPVVIAPQTFNGLFRLPLVDISETERKYS